MDKHLNEIIELYKLGKLSFEIARILGIDSLYVFRVVMNYETALMCK